MCKNPVLPVFVFCFCILLGYKKCLVKKIWFTEKGGVNKILVQRGRTNVTKTTVALTFGQNNVIDFNSGRGKAARTNVVLTSVTWKVWSNSCQ